MIYAPCSLKISQVYSFNKQYQYGPFRPCISLTHLDHKSNGYDRQKLTRCTRLFMNRDSVHKLSYRTRNAFLCNWFRRLRVLSPHPCRFTQHPYPLRGQTFVRRAMSVAVVGLTSRRLGRRLAWGMVRRQKCQTLPDREGGGRPLNLLWTRSSRSYLCFVL